MTISRSNRITVLLIILVLICPGFAITVFPSNTQPRAYSHNRAQSAILSDQDLFHQSCSEESTTHKNATVHFSSYSDFSHGKIYPTADSFVRGTIDAWAQHQHLVLRADEVWFSILTQMNFYMTKNAESVRHLFVNHSGKEEIIVEDVDWISVLGAFSHEIQARVKTPWLLDWIMPNFTTTTETDIMTANVLMMGLMQSYFDYIGGIICGLPSITLLGDKSDWQQLLLKLEHLPDFGTEPKAYAYQLRPILSRFVQTFDTPDDPDLRTFWNSIVYATEQRDICGAPPYVLDGWLMGFFFWDREGKSLHQSTRGSVAIDGIRYSPRAIDDLPVGYSQAPFTMIDFQGMSKFPAYVLAGNLGKQIEEGLPEGYAEALRRFNGSLVNETLPHGTLKPLSGWMIYGPAPSLTEVLPGWDAEYQHLISFLDQTYTPKCPGPDRIDLGSGSVESVAYEGIHENLRHTYNEQQGLDWDDDY